MREVVTNVQEAKSVIECVEGLSALRVTGRTARMNWTQLRGQRVKVVELPDAPILSEFGQSIITVARLDGGHGLEEFRQIEATKEQHGSEIVIEYEETQADIDGDGEATDAVDTQKAIESAALSGFTESVKSGGVDSGVKPIDATDPGGIDAATQAVEAAQDAAQRQRDEDV